MPKEKKVAILEATQFLDSINPPFGLRIQSILLNIISIPTCRSESCDNFCTWNWTKKPIKFTEYCCVACANKETKGFKQEQISKEQLYDFRINQKLSKGAIATMFGLQSTSVIDKLLKKYRIPNIKLSKTSKEIFSDKEYLEHHYSELKKSTSIIAQEHNVHESAIVYWIKKHDIDRNKFWEYPNNYNKVSKPHQEIIDILKTIYDGELQINNRTILNDGYELDIFLPEKNLAIEYNGFPKHWYNPNSDKFSLRHDNRYHVSKTNQCEEKDIQLLHIFPCSWRNKSNIWISIFKNKLGLSDKIYARKCEIKEVSVNETRVFLDNNHLQGFTQSNIKLGLYYKDELVALMTFGKSRYNKNYEWELIRFCSKLEYTIVGGFSRLLQHFRNVHDGNIVSYADRMYSNGHVYETNGFKLLHVNPPTYWYLEKNKDIPLHRMNFQKHKITFKGDTRTEEDIMLNEKEYKKFYDCGTKTYIIE